MFDKYKKRWAKMEEDHESLRRAHTHLEKYQVVYACGATAIICIIGTRIFATPVINTMIEPGSQMLPEIAPVFNNTVAPVISPVMSNVVNNAGHCTKVVQDTESGDLWSQISELAEELAEKHDIPFDSARVMLSRHLNGKRDQVFGKTYRTIALGTTG